MKQQKVTLENLYKYYFVINKLIQLFNNRKLKIIFQNNSIFYNCRQAQDLIKNNLRILFKMNNLNNKEKLKINKLINILKMKEKLK